MTFGGAELRRSVFSSLFVPPRIATLAVLSSCVGGEGDESGDFIFDKRSETRDRVPGREPAASGRWNLWFSIIEM